MARITYKGASGPLALSACTFVRTVMPELQAERLPDLPSRAADE